MVHSRSRLVAQMCGAVLLLSIPACASTENAAEGSGPEAAVDPYSRDNTCTAGDAVQSDAEPAGRLTQLSHTAGELLLVNGIAPGPQVAVGGQLSSDQAADRASTVPGDASITEALWVAAIPPEAGLDPVRDTEEYFASQARRISTFEVTEENLGQLLGPNWSSVIDVVEGFARNGYEDYVEQVRGAPPMREADAAATRARLRAASVDAGLESQWRTAQSIVPIYFQSCDLSSNVAGHDVDLSSSVLAEVLAADAVAAAFTTSFAPPAMVEPLARGLQIALGAETNPTADGGLTKDYDPNEILSPEDVELMEAEEPSLEGP
ncbi:hypothetical protein HQ325_17035 [Rhodococcus sp. BP-349]|uniref:hypothetical protein n=1 Tax=unclassified Rhodococcus (in: high G+C Gram-positive bacteria) TaxID=192944 RepID=UPI001C9AD404|nr:MULTISPECIES: hypothetical protein [unclassified Rhodococcus (in: high G+C Gram-positive bacteria)]MBY6540382.1 hypothetical protein [Rhodococcus sp. BP-363]MBY6545593.1 hypothetical protein [Rhodococcus sp. BP-369]MBY6564823.1 hypothetical protein [Rhodococcus sp. BP-370]MBY6578241.1 hypothetical protein [Rhodococcus sp. BP-364]MBY6587542.1 hypothetical protein [Rhodococcus sp. BP-358]